MMSEMMLIDEDIYLKHFNPKTFRELVIYHHFLLENCISDELLPAYYSNRRPEMILKQIKKYEEELNKLDGEDLNQLTAKRFHEICTNYPAYFNFDPRYSEEYEGQYDLIMQRIAEWQPKSAAGQDF